MTELTPNAPGEVELPRPPGVFRRWLGAHPRAVDWIIVGGYLFGCALMMLFGVFAGRTPDLYSDIPADAAEEIRMQTAFVTWPWVLVSVAVTAVVALALRLRRRFPLAGLILVSALLILDLGLLAVPNSIAAVFLLYAIPVYRSVPAGWVGFGVSAILSTSVLVVLKTPAMGLIGPAGLMLSGPERMADWLGLAIMNTLWMLAVLMIGINMGNRRRYVDALIDRARQLAREREQQAELAAAAERARIAREMHDIVAHSLSVVVTLSEAAAVSVEKNPESAKQTMRRASQTGRDALAEMRRLLGVLRDPAQADGTRGIQHAPQPGIAQLPELMQGFREAGLEIELSESGVPCGDASQQLTVYRIAQEALTNALRHGGRVVRAAIEHSPDRTVIEVIDSGSAAAAGSAAERAIVGSGMGLVGARQRAEMFGGSLESGPLGDGWRVLAVVPVQGVTVQDVKE